MVGAHTFGLEISDDPHYNRKYLAEAFVSYSFCILFLYVAWTLAAPVLISSENGFLRGVGGLNYIFNYYMCHQMPERSLLLLGSPLPLCERCLAIFVGALIAYPAAAHRARLPKFLSSFWFVILALVPIGIDGVTQLLGMRESGTLLRVFSGLLSGFAVVYYLIATILERYSTGKPYARIGLVIPTLAMLACLVLPLIAGAFYVGAQYLGPHEAVAAAFPARGALADTVTFYIPPHATLSIPADAFLSSYEDPILSDVSGDWRTFGKHALGVWVVVDRDPQKGQAASNATGRYSYLSSENGRGAYAYVDAWTGEVFKRTMHR